MVIGIDSNEWRCPFLQVEEQKIKLDQLLRLLLVKNTPEGSPVEDATHLLHRGRGRMRGRPSKQKSQIK